MTEFEKMRREEFYDFTSEECLASYYRAKHICAKLQTMTIEDADYRETIEDLIPGIPESSTVSPPFHCDHGHGIKLGENVFINYNGTMLDGGLIPISSRTTTATMLPRSARRTRQRCAIISSLSTSKKPMNWASVWSANVIKTERFK